MTLRKLPFCVVNNVFEVRSRDSIAKCVYVSYTNLLGNSPIRHRRERCWKKSTCPSAHATDITEPGASDGTCKRHNSQTPLIDEKKSKNCAQKHMAAPGSAVRWAHRCHQHGSAAGRYWGACGHREGVRRGIRGHWGLGEMCEHSAWQAGGQGRSARLASSKRAQARTSARVRFAWAAGAAANRRENSRVCSGRAMRGCVRARAGHPARSAAWHTHFASKIAQNRAKSACSASLRL